MAQRYQVDIMTFQIKIYQDVVIHMGKKCFICMMPTSNQTNPMNGRCKCKWMIQNKLLQDRGRFKKECFLHLTRSTSKFWKHMRRCLLAKADGLHWIEFLACRKNRPQKKCSLKKELESLLIGFLS